MMRKINHAIGVPQSVQSFPKAKSLQENGHTYQYIQIDSKHEEYYKGPIKGLLMYALLVASVIIVPLAIFGALFSQDYRNTWSRALTGKEVVFIELKNTQPPPDTTATSPAIPAKDFSSGKGSLSDADQIPLSGGFSAGSAATPPHHPDLPRESSVRGNSRSNVKDPFVELPVVLPRDALEEGDSFTKEQTAMDKEETQKTDRELAERVEITSIKTDKEGQKGILKKSSAQKTPSSKNIQFSVPEATFSYEQLAQEIDAIYSSEALCKMQQANSLLKKHELNARDILENAEAKKIFTNKKGAKLYLQAKERAFNGLKLTKTDRKHLPHDNQDKVSMKSQAAMLFIQKAIGKTLEKMPLHATAEALHKDLQEQFDTRLDEDPIFSYFSFLNILENEATKALFMKELRLVDVLIHAFPEKKNALLNEYKLLMAPHTETLAQEGAAGEPSLTQIFSVADTLFGSEDSIAALHGSSTEINALVRHQLAKKNITLEKILHDEKSRELFAKSPILVQVLFSAFPAEKNALVAQYILLNREKIAPVTTEAAEIDDIWEENVLAILKQFTIKPKIFFADHKIVKYFILSRKLKSIAEFIRENQE
jgi:hypothetical protein